MHIHTALTGTCVITGFQDESGAAKELHATRRNCGACAFYAARNLAGAITVTAELLPTTTRLPCSGGPESNGHHRQNRIRRPSGKHGSVRLLRRYLDDHFGGGTGGSVAFDSQMPSPRSSAGSVRMVQPTVRRPSSSSREPSVSVQNPNKHAASGLG